MRQRIFFTLFIAVVTIPLLAYAGTLTMTSYYPAPTGNYDRINANNIGVGTVNIGSTLTVGGQGTGYATIGNSGCGGNFTGIQLNGTAMTCANYSIVSDGTDLYLNRPTNSRIRFRENNAGTDQLTILNGGNIGVNQLNPSEKFEIANGNLYINNAASRLYLGNGSKTAYINSPNPNTLAMNTNSAERLRIDDNGNVGIGINPTSLLHVNGTTTISGVTTINNSATIANGLTITANGLAVNAGATALNGGATIAAGLTVSTGGLSVTSPGTTSLGGLASLNGGATIIGATNINNGSLAINNAGTLSVTGNSTLSGLVAVGGAALNNTYPLNLQGSLQVSGGSIYNADGGYFYGSSDRRLKERVRPIENAVTKVKSLNGVTFRWKKDSKKSVGVIAQDVEKVFPELVYTDKQGMKSVAYPNLIAVLIEATKEQQRQIDALKKEVALLKKQNKK